MIVASQLQIPFCPRVLKTGWVGRNFDVWFFFCLFLFCFFKDWRSNFELFCIFIDPNLEYWLILHCHAVKKVLAKSCRERWLWNAQHFALQSALPYLPQVLKQGSLCCVSVSPLSCSLLFFFFFFAYHAWVNPCLPGRPVTLEKNLGTPRRCHCPFLSFMVCWNEYYIWHGFKWEQKWSIVVLRERRERNVSYLSVELAAGKVGQNLSQCEF